MSGRHTQQPRNPVAAQDLALEGHSSSAVGSVGRSDGERRQRHIKAVGKEHKVAVIPDDEGPGLARGCWRRNVRLGHVAAPARQGEMVVGLALTIDAVYLKSRKCAPNLSLEEWGQGQSRWSNSSPIDHKPVHLAPLRRTLTVPLVPRVVLETMTFRCAILLSIEEHGH